ERLLSLTITEGGAPIRSPHAQEHGGSQNVCDGGGQLGNGKYAHRMKWRNEKIVGDDQPESGRQYSRPESHEPRREGSGHHNNYEDGVGERRGENRIQYSPKGQCDRENKEGEDVAISRNPKGETRPSDACVAAGHGLVPKPLGQRSTAY